MSKKAAHVNNKMDVRINVGNKQVEHITVHPNMFQLPRVGDHYMLVAVSLKVEDGDHQEVDAQHVGKVVSVSFYNTVVRTKCGGRYTTELQQGVTITLHDPELGA